MPNTMLDPVTHRYAEALFCLARDEGVFDAVRADVERLGREVNADGVGDFFFDARVSIETRREKMHALTKTMHPFVQNFVNLLFDKRREEVLRGLAEAFKAMALEEAGAAEGVVESARPLGAAEIAELEAGLGKKLGKRLSLENRIRPELLGGVRVIVGSKMVDHSLLGRLDGLKKGLLNAPLPSLAEA
ncbi:MAG TPA: ATP synthase F1 subunit delta [Planctomycetes bacterium]|nr:ATP synthase F1 subunit delta [Planctomycetota bacterium]